ncbi:MAG: hypothetical protein GWP08_18245 [Nitrospiraceae bacterium]|nr:hypothetical protein [Nitrospiraceae bacterium]
MSRIQVGLSISLVLATVVLVGCPKQPVVEVSATSHHFGVTPPDTYETVWTFEVWNANSNGTTLVFEAAATKAWIDVAPVTGQSTGPDDKVTVTVTIDRGYSAKAAPAFLSGAVNITSDVGNKVVALTTAPDYFTEEFSGDLDVANKSIIFEPNASPSFYGATQEDAAAFPEDPAGGALLDFSIADPIEVLPWYGANVRLYGVNYDSFYIGSTGTIGFGLGAGAKAGISLADHFDIPRITGLSSVDATAGGDVSVLQTADKVVVTYEDVPTAAKQGGNDFQIEMSFDGTIRITYLDVDADSGIAGLSYGPGGATVPADFLDSDLTGYNTAPLKAAL